MGPDGVWRRIRWDNVARLAGLVALALVVVAWPRLSGRAPQLPPATAMPLAPTQRAPARPAGSGSRGAKPRAAEKRRAGAGRRSAVKRRVRAERRARVERRSAVQRRCGGGAPGGG